MLRLCCLSQDAFYVGLDVTCRLSCITVLLLFASRSLSCSLAASLVFQRCIPDSLIAVFESRRKQIAWETLSFVFKKRAPQLSAKYESHPLQFGHDWGEMWIIFCPLHPVWWMGERETHRKPAERLEKHICVFGGGAHPACGAERFHAYQCLPCRFTAKVPTVFVFLLQQPDMRIWKGNAGIIDTGARCKNSIWHACLGLCADRNGCFHATPAIFA